VERWNLEPTYRLIETAFGAAQQRLAYACIRSMLDRRAFASYHYTEALRLTRTFERKYLEGHILLDIYDQDSVKKRSAFERYILKAGAHAAAAVQSIHALPDILAHAVYFATAQNMRPEPLKEDKIAPSSVALRLDGDPRFKPLAPLLSTIQSGSLWKHLVALSNLSKHRTIVRTVLSEDMTGARQRLRELQFKSCEYRGKHYPAVSLQALLEPEDHRLSVAILTLGNQLNDCLQRKEAPARLAR
jgi:hypothetical protein